MKITEFLLARIAEDEANAKAAGPDGGEWSSRYPEQPEFHMFGDFGWVVSGPGVETEDSDWGRAVADHIARYSPARILAECDAKREILEWHGAIHDIDDERPCPTLRALAMPFKEHPDYDERWRL